MKKQTNKQARHKHLTLCRIDEVLPIFVQFFDKPVGFVQLRFVRLYLIPKAGAVQIALTELQRV